MNRSLQKVRIKEIGTADLDYTLRAKKKALRSGSSLLVE